LPSPKTFLRYWDFSLPSAEVHPTTVSKYNTLLQLLLIGATLTLPVLTATPALASWLSNAGVGDAVLANGVMGLQGIVAATTAWSGLSYAVLKNAVTILGNDESLKAKQGARGRAIIGVTFGSVVIAAAWLALDRDEDEGVAITEEEMEGGR
jgi:cardiolipin synthase